MARSSSTQPGQAGATAQGGSPATRETASGTCVASFSWGPQHAGSGALAYAAGRPMGSRETPLEPTPRVGFPAKRGGRRRAVVCCFFRAPREPWCPTVNGCPYRRYATVAASNARPWQGRLRVPAPDRPQPFQRPCMRDTIDSRPDRALARRPLLFVGASTKHRPRMRKKCLLRYAINISALHAENIFTACVDLHDADSTGPVSVAPTTGHRPQKKPSRNGRGYGVCGVEWSMGDQFGGGGPGITSGSTSPALFRRS